MTQYQTNNSSPKKLPQRKSIRLKGYDYAQAGLYFVTLCVQNRECLFGKIETQEMQLNDAGKMVVKWYFELEQKFNDIKCHEMVVMPNHFHCIIENVGADLRVCPDDLDKSGSEILGEHGSEILGEHGSEILGEHAGSPLHRVVGWFKTMTTNEYIRGVKTLGWQRFDGKLWQRNYYEHIIRNEQSYERISNYIIDNPIKWDEDKLK